jgi:hypothetical protein
MQAGSKNVNALKKLQAGPKNVNALKNASGLKKCSCAEKMQAG